MRRSYGNSRFSSVLLQTRMPTGYFLCLECACLPAPSLADSSLPQIPAQLFLLRSPPALLQSKLDSPGSPLSLKSVWFFT